MLYDITAWTMLPAGIENGWLFVALGSLAALLIGISKAGFGGGISILSLPILIFACHGKTTLATGVMLPILMTCDLVAVISWRGQWDLRAAKSLVPGALIGIAIGSAAIYLFDSLDMSGEHEVTDAALKLMIGVIALGFVTLRAIRHLRSRPMAFRPTRAQGIGAGTIAGFTSMLAHAAGPVVGMYLLPQQMPKNRYVATTVAFFWLGNLIKLLPYVLLGMIYTHTLGASLLLLPAVVIGALLGVFLHKRIGQRSFTGIVYTLLALAGLHFIYRAVQSLWG